MKVLFLGEWFAGEMLALVKEPSFEFVIEKLGIVGLLGCVARRSFNWDLSSGSSVCSLLVENWGDKL